MSVQILQSQYLHCMQGTSNKVYSMHQVTDGTKYYLCTAYGPYTAAKENITRNVTEFNSQYEMVKELQRLYRDKMKKDYRPVASIPQGICLPYTPTFSNVVSAAPKAAVPDKPGKPKPAIVTTIELF